MRSNLYTRITKFIKRYIHDYSIIKTDLLRGQYYDIDERMLYANFQLLVDFVEIECAHMARICFPKESKAREGWRWYLPDLFAKRDADLGCFYLKSKVGEPEQDARDREILDLYWWWTKNRPARQPIEPPDIDNSYQQWFENSEVQEWAQLANQQDDNFYREDNLMLKSLIDIRGSLWT